MPSQHFTEPPPRYSEASLVKRMEELGIGRPSTYASILQVLKDRGYVRIDKKRLVPEDKGRVLTAFLESFFARYVEYDFTAGLEEQLDRISNNEMAWRDLLRDFWREFTAAVGDIKELRVTEVIDALDEMLAPHLFPPREDGTDPRKCPTCETGRLSLKLGKFGGFIGCTNYPECRYTRQLAPGNGANGGPDGGIKKLGEDPADRARSDAALGPLRALCAARRGGRGREAQARRPAEGRVARRRRSRLARSGCSRCRARSASIPRTASRSWPASAASAPMSSTARPTPISPPATTCSRSGLNRAVTLIEEKKAKGPRKSRFGADPGRALGDHPDKGGPDRGQERPLRALCQPRRRQRHAARRHDAGSDHARAGDRTARGAGGAQRQSKKPPAKRRSSGRKAPPSRRPRRAAQAARPTGRPVRTDKKRAA